MACGFRDDTRRFLKTRAAFGEAWRSAVMLADETPRNHSRRDFCRALSLPAGLLVLGRTVPAWASSKKRSQGEPMSAPAQQDSAETKYESKVLWDFDGCIEDRFMKRVTVTVYNGNAYAWVLLPELKTMIVKVPLAGGKAQICPLMPGHVTGNDPHRYYTIGADAEGYIHVVGDMHSSAHVKHWISKRPEDISEFVYTSDLGENKRPQGYNVTYPHLFRSPEGVLYHSIRCADPVWGIGISVLDVKTQTWTMLGADVPADDISKGNRAKKAAGRPMTAWEDNGEGGNFSYTQPHAQIQWDKNKRMHVVFALLNKNTSSAKGRHTASDVLYAYSDDGGKTFHRGDGSQIQMPMRAEPGPHQADMVYSRHDGPPPWVGLMPMFSIDEKGRPVVKAQDYKTGWHTFVLDDGKWSEVGKSTIPLATGQPAKSEGADDEDESDELGMADPSRLHLPYEPYHVANEYRRETGNLVYFHFPEKDRAHGDKPKLNHVMLILSSPVSTAKKNDGK